MKKNILTIFLFSLFFSACFKPELSFVDSGKLSFSVDTLTFDTIFTGIGSTTKHLKVYNPNTHAVKINKIHLSQPNSQFKLNIDGYSKNTVENIELPAGDSLYIFVSVLINPATDNLLVLDSLIFEQDNLSQDIDLVAFGQNVHLINGKDSTGIVTTQTWTADKPYLVYNSMLVDKNQILTINEGTKIYFHQHSRMYVLGSLIVNGSAEAPVIFTGDRLEEWYEDAPGQWAGIWLLAGSKDNIIQWAEIKNGIEGLVVDTFANDKPTLSLLNTKIENMNNFGLLARGAHIFAANCLFANCGQVAVGLIIGGQYEFYHCTIANYWSYFPRQTPALYLNNYYTDTLGNYYIRNMEKAYFANCIVYGGASTEFYADSFPNIGEMNYMFYNSLLRVDETSNTSNTSHFQKCIINPPDFKFQDINKNDYQLDSLSPAKDKADPQIVNSFYKILSTDLNNNSRLRDAAPDIGAYERVPKQEPK